MMHAMRVAAAALDCAARFALIDMPGFLCCADYAPLFSFRRAAAIARHADDAELLFMPPFMRFDARLLPRDAAQRVTR